MSYLVFIVVSVIFLVWLVYMNPFLCVQMKEYPSVEFLWTVLPLSILLSIAVPSMYHLYELETSSSVSLVIKVLGSQWFWSYYYSDFGVQVDSYMVPSEDLKLGSTNLLTCESSCVVPFGVGLQFLVSSSDVLHSWALPSLVVKVDAIPGVSSVVLLNMPYPGLYSGMCSELCGAYHSYMPISVEATSPALFKKWISLL